MAKNEVQIAFTGSEEYRDWVIDRARERRMKTKWFLQMAVERVVGVSYEEWEAGKRPESAIGADSYENVNVKPVSSHDAAAQSLDSIQLGEPAEWSILAEAASKVLSVRDQAMYRSIRFQLEWLAASASRESSAQELPLRYTADGRLRAPVVDDPSNPLYIAAGAEEPEQDGARDHGEKPTPATGRAKAARKHA